MSIARNLHQNLIETAHTYADLGWSVVPLWGDSRPDQAKVAAISWSPYQRRRAGVSQIDDWFGRRQYAGLGVVTGRISQLVVLDFDTPELFQTFADALPALVATRTVLTRRGRHLYFRVPPHLRVASRKLAGIDLLADGHYVVAPPTSIDGFSYRVWRGGLPKTLTQDDIDHINTFFDRLMQERTIASPERPESRLRVYAATSAVESQEEAIPCAYKPLPPLNRPGAAVEAHYLTAEALVTLYRGLTGPFKRNVALFRTSCLARDHGWRYEAVVAVLAGPHVDAPPGNQHRYESPKARRREAVRTIRSAFSKPPRLARPQDPGGLFNSIREKLMQLGQTYVVRVLEGLRLAGVKVGQLVSERTMSQLLKGLVGRHSIRLALAAQTPSGTPIFERLSPRHPPQRFAATQIRIDRHTNAYVKETKPDSIRGRQEIHFRVPSPDALCKRLGVTPSGSDPLDLADLKTPKQTRQALQRELVRRRPGTYLRKWLADRLGVSERTMSRYNGQITDVHAVPTFTQTPLYWSNLNAIPTPEVTPVGTCLEDSTGKRWPARKGIAQKLLAQGRGVKLLVRSLNYYWYGTGDPPAAPGFQVRRAVDIAPAAPTDEPMVTSAQRIERLVRTLKIRPPDESPPAQPATPSVPHPQPEARPRQPVAAAPTRVRQQRYRRPFKDASQEALALQVYTLVNVRTAEADRRVSRATVRQWIDRYGPEAVLTSLETLRTRARVQTPAAFMATLLRSSAR